VKVTDNQEDYEAIALRLAGDAVLLKQVQERLASNRLTHPLFDTARFRRHIEAAYQNDVGNLAARRASTSVQRRAVNRLPRCARGIVHSPRVRR